MEHRAALSKQPTTARVVRSSSLTTLTTPTASMLFKQIAAVKESKSTIAVSQSSRIIATKRNVPNVSIFSVLNGPKPFTFRIAQVPSPGWLKWCRRPKSQKKDVVVLAQAVM